MKDYYSILGVSTNATTAEIKKAYRKLALKFHPDRNNGDLFAEEKFKEIQNAYEILTGSTKKTQYDPSTGNRKDYQSEKQEDSKDSKRNAQRDSPKNDFEKGKEEQKRTDEQRRQRQQKEQQRQREQKEQKQREQEREERRREQYKKEKRQRKNLYFGIAVVVFLILAYFVDASLTNDNPKPKTHVTVEPTIIEKSSNSINRNAFISAESYANIRSGSSTEYEIIGSLNRGSQVYIYDQDVNSGWYSVKIHGKKGFVSNKLISFERVSLNTNSEASTVTNEGRLGSSLKKRQLIGKWDVFDNQNRGAVYNFDSNGIGNFIAKNGTNFPFNWILQKGGRQLKITLNQDNSIWQWDIISSDSEEVKMYSSQYDIERQIKRNRSSNNNERQISSEVLVDYKNSQRLGLFRELELRREPCRFTFNSFEIGEDSRNIIGIHTILNCNEVSRVAKSGINAPGNESSYAGEATIDALKRFQSLKNLAVTGKIDGKTRLAMKQQCEILEQFLFESRLDKQTKDLKFFGAWKSQGEDVTYQFFNNNRGKRKEKDDNWRSFRWSYSYFMTIRYDDRPVYSNTIISISANKIIWRDQETNRVQTLVRIH